MKLVLASNNNGKIAEFKRILQHIENIELLCMKDFQEDITIIENGKTFEENAIIKATTVSQKIHLPVIADDSGLCIPYLNGEPGVLSARYLGENTPYEIKNQNILDRLSGVENEKRSAYFHCSIVCVFENDDRICVSGKCSGRIGDTIDGNNGFGYDPIFYVGEKSFASMSSDEKDAVSHRGIALKNFSDKLQDYIQNRKKNVLVLTGKQRSNLLSLANPLKAIIQVGKNGIQENLIKQINDTLENRELIKIKTHETAGQPPHEIADIISRKTDSTIVRVIGSIVILYKKSRENPQIKL